MDDQSITLRLTARRAPDGAPLAGYELELRGPDGLVRDAPVMSAQAVEVVLSAVEAAFTDAYILRMDRCRMAGSLEAWLTAAERDRAGIPAQAGEDAGEPDQQPVTRTGEVLDLQRRALQRLAAAQLRDDDELVTVKAGQVWELEDPFDFVGYAAYNDGVAPRCTVAVVRSDTVLFEPTDNGPDAAKLSTFLRSRRAACHPQGSWRLICDAPASS